VDAVVRRIAETVLYEGHVLWPYRRSALKNRERWTFGRLYPEAHRAEGDASALQMEALLEANGPARLRVIVRFLPIVTRQAMVNGQPVDALEVGGRRYVTWDETTEREIAMAPFLAGGAPAGRRFRVPAGRDQEDVLDRRRIPAGTLVRTWQELHGNVEARTEPVADGLFRLVVRVSNTTPWSDGGEDRLLASTFLSTHLVAAAEDGSFVSLQDPPEALRHAAVSCQNVNTWPVLVGDPDDRSTLLAAPIVLYDHPQIAPESPGDFFDATEIDQMLVLNVLALTDEERREMAASDPRARAIAERCAALSVDEFMRLHGAIRDPRPLEEG